LQYLQGEDLCSSISSSAFSHFVSSHLLLSGFGALFVASGAQGAHSMSLLRGCMQRQQLSSNMPGILLSLVLTCQYPMSHCQVQSVLFVPELLCSLQMVAQGFTPAAVAV
jgi:hypothetical protein